MSSTGWFADLHNLEGVHVRCEIGRRSNPIERDCLRIVYRFAHRVDPAPFSCDHRARVAKSWRDVQRTAGAYNGSVGATQKKGGPAKEPPL